MKILTDEECNEFRRLPKSFNDMVRAIYESGYTSRDEEVTELTKSNVEAYTTICKYMDMICQVSTILDVPLNNILEKLPGLIRDLDNRAQKYAFETDVQALRLGELERKYNKLLLRKEFNDD